MLKICMFKAIHYYLQMYLKTLETSVLKYMNSILLIFISTRISMQAYLKKTEIRLELLTNIDMLLMVENEIRGGIWHAKHRYAQANNKYMKNYNKNIESLYLVYLHANNLYGWTISQRLLVNGFEWMEQLSEADERFKKNYDENNDKIYILEVDIKYPKNLFNLYCDLPV